MRANFLNMTKETNHVDTYEIMSTNLTTLNHNRIRVILGPFRLALIRYYLIILDVLKKIFKYQQL